MLIAMAFHSLDERRVGINAKVLRSLVGQLRPQDRLILIDNASIPMCRTLLHSWVDTGNITQISLIENTNNVGTADAINMAWSRRFQHEICVKMDDDVIIHQPNWIELLEEVFSRDPKIGICGLKRRDLEERPGHEKVFYRSVLRMLPHRKGERWLAVEDVLHVMGTCQAYNPSLLDAIGGLYQMQDQGNVYGFDDALASVRSAKAGFKTCFLVGVDIDHIDPGGDTYTQWKVDESRKWQGRYQQVAREIQSGTRSIFYPISTCDSGNPQPVSRGGQDDGTTH